MDLLSHKNIKRTRGMLAYREFIKGNKLSRKDAILAKCFECMAGYVDGIADCMVYRCPLYPFYPFKGKKSRKSEMKGKVHKSNKKEVRL